MALIREQVHVWDVIESKLVLLATQQAHKLRDEVLGQGIATYLESQLTEKMVD